MKKYFFRVLFYLKFCVLLAVMLIFKTNLPSTLVFASSSNYYKVKNDCILFKTNNLTSDDFSNIYFKIPTTYFVTLLNESDGVAKVKYGNFIGYVNILSLSKVDFIPQNPTLLNVTFNINNDSGTHIRSVPITSNTSNILTTIPAGTKNINYIASINAETPPGGSDNTWFYCEYSPENSPTSVFTGYIYSERCNSLSAIEANLEENIQQEILGPTNIDDNLSTEDAEIMLSPEVRVIFITLICLPIVILFIIFCFKAKNKHVNNTKGHDEIINIDNDDNIQLSNSNNGTRFIGKTFEKKDNLKNFLTDPSTLKEHKTLNVLDDEDDNLL